MKQTTVASNKKSLMNIVNPKHIKQLTNAHNIFAFINEKYGTQPNWTRPQGFISLSKIILEQQVSLASANAHFLKLNGYLVEFTPSNILKLTDEEMRSCQISRQKAKYLREFNESFYDKFKEIAELDFFRLKNME